MAHILDKVIAQFKELGVDDPWGADPEETAIKIAEKYSNEVLENLDNTLGNLVVHLYTFHRVFQCKVHPDAPKGFVEAYAAVPKVVQVPSTTHSKEFIHTWHTILARLHRVDPIPLDSPNSFYTWLSNNLSATDKIIFTVHTSAMGPDELYNWLKEIAKGPSSKRIDSLVN